MYYKLSLFYNLIVKQKYFKKRNSYSQFQEDKFILEFFSNVSKGFYIDIGCYHPIKYNNTALLYNAGWSGINIDINQTSIDLFDIVRKKDKNICAAISNETGLSDFYFDHKFSPINSLNKNFVQNLSKKILNRELKKKKINKYTFSDLIKTNKITINNIDFLNIDVESHDFEVLEGMDLKKYKPKLICTELYNDKLELDEKKFKDFLIKYNYALIKKIGPNGLFSLKESE